MPITKALAFWDSSGKPHKTAEAAQHAELLYIFEAVLSHAGLDREVLASEPFDQETRLDGIVKGLLREQDALVTALTTGPRSRPSTRKRAGTTNPRRATKQQAAAGFKAMRDAVDHGGTNATRDADVPAEPVGAD